VPILGVLLAWALLGEAPSPIEALGIALIGAALVAISVGRRP
jgi:drug/metabolite transporter (DMT)-like permease